MNQQEKRFPRFSREARRPIEDMSPEERAELFDTDVSEEWKGEQEYCDRAAGRAQEHDDDAEIRSPTRRQA